MTLEQRIEKIERTNRRLRLAVLCMVGGFVASLWFGAEPTGMDWQTAVMADDTQKDVPVQQLIRARQIELVNAKGKTVISLIHKNGRGNVTTFNDQGQMLVAIVGSSAGHGAMALFHKTTGKKLVVMGARDDGLAGALTLQDSATEKKYVVISGEKGGGYLNTYDPETGKRLVLIGYAAKTKDNHGAITTFNKQGQKSTVLSGSQVGGHFATYNPQGQQLVFLGAHRPKGYGYMITRDASGKPLLNIGADGSSGDGINAFDLSGKRYSFQRSLVK